MARGGAYQALPAHDELDEDDERVLSSDEQRLSQSAATLPERPTAAHVGSSRRPHQHARTRSSSAGFNVDIQAIDAAFKDWMQSINNRFSKSKKKYSVDKDKPYEIMASVFGPVERSNTQAETVLPKTLDHNPPGSEGFEEKIEAVRTAIRHGVQPRLNAAGTSGSYFAKGPEGKTRGIFKPKNEEPYGSLNPKWSKWFHRNLLSPFFGFGRACLVPNFSYLSETGASLLSDRLELYIVPKTGLVSLSSPAFFYDWLDRRAYKQKKRPLPEKIGSFQLFLDGYKDASDFLKMHPWPGRANRDTLALSGARAGRRKRKRNWTRNCRLLCGTAGFDDAEGADDDSGYYQEDDVEVEPENRVPNTEFTWTQELMQDFQAELEKLVILDVLMRNTDRGLDNFMIKICQGTCGSPSSSNLHETKEASDSVKRQQPQAKQALSLNGIANSKPWPDRPHVHIAAIDNSLSFPIHHPNSWRSYMYGWAFLPASLIGQPFTKATREHFLPILTSPKWWAETVFELRKLFEQDEDFSERMFKRQISVMKGQAWNIVASLRDPDAGPLELCRRRACVVHDDETVVADDDFTKEMLEATATAEEPTANGSTVPRPVMPRNKSVDGRSTPTHPVNMISRPDRPPVVRPASLHNIHVSPKPLPVAKRVDLSRSTFGNATGVVMMEHMERLQEEEEREIRQHPDLLEAYDDDQPYGSISRTRAERQGVSLDFGRPQPVFPDESRRVRSGSIDAYAVRSHERSGSAPHTEEGAPTKVVIVERLEEVDARPFFAKW